MKRLLYYERPRLGSAVLVVTGLVLFITARSCREIQVFSAESSGVQDAVPALGEVRMVSPHEVDAQVRSGAAVLVDVREENEVGDGMASPARWMPLSRMNPGDLIWMSFLNGINRKTLVIFYCRSGKRSEQAARKLSALGYSTANMGSYSSWVEAGLPTKMK